MLQNVKGLSFNHYGANEWAESEEELKSFLMTVKVESEKVGLELNIQKTNIMASGPITSWKTDGETLFWGTQNHCIWLLQP